MDIMNRQNGVTLREKRGGSFKFCMHVTKDMGETPLDALDLSVRAYNCLKRAGYNTVGELAEAISSGVDLKSVRNCGKTSVREIMEHLFLFQYNSLPETKRDAYLAEVVGMNKHC